MRSAAPSLWLVIFAFVVAGFPLSADAQVTTAGIRGTVKADDGIAIELAEVTLLHEASQIRRTAYTNDSGEFAFTGQRVGGPYTLTVKFEGYLPIVMRNIHLALGKIPRVSLTLRLVEDEGEVIEIEGNKVLRTPSQRFVFGEEDINELPSISRDPKDIARLSPDAYTDGNALSIGGANNRFNSLTIDGVRVDDDFGLNSSGYPTSRSPIALNSIEQISVERTPFDVRYSRFLGGNINVVTKSGTNEFHGSLFSAFTNQSLVGGELNGRPLDEIEFREARYGLNLGGPIIKDKLHFFISVEGLNASTPSSVGPAGSGAANEIDGITSDDVDRIRDIARDVYGFNAGVPSRSLDEIDLKLLTKIDWSISDQHRLSAKYQRTQGNVVRDSFAFGNNLPLTSNWYDQTDGLHSFALQLNSNWTSALATRFEMAGKLVDSRPKPLQGTNFPQAEITTPDGGTVIIGPDPFRHANQLDNDQIHMKAEADYLLGTHILLGGLEYDYLDVFNLFVPFSRGVAEFDTIDEFELQQPSSLFYANAISNNPRDAAADFRYGTFAAYVQDRYAVNSDLTVQGGLRFETYHAPGNIAENQNFIDRYGFSNTETISGRYLFLPRVGATYRPIENLNLRSGFGLYGGGAPNVWLANSYSNTGVATDSAFESDGSVLTGFDGRSIPDSIQGQLVPGDGNVDALDPGFDLPSSWKTSAGADYILKTPVGRTKLETTYVFSKVRHGVVWRDLRRDHGGFADNEPIGTLPDGRPYYDNDDTDGSSFDERRGYDMLLTNTHDGRSHTLSLAANTELPYGFGTYVGYSYQNVTEVSPANSSRSVSNYGLAAVSDPNNPGAARSNYERRHRVVASLRFAKALFGDGPTWGDKKTTLGVFLESRSGQPFSYTFGDSSRGDDLARLFGEEREFARRNRQLFYVPDGSGSDVILSGIEEEEFNQFLSDSGLSKFRGRIVDRNGFTSQWFHRIDLRFGQEFPGLLAGHKGKLFIDIQNVGNLINSEWGEYKQVPFPYTVPVVDVDVDPATGRYIYSNLRSGDPETVSVSRSLWRMQINLMLSF